MKGQIQLVLSIFKLEFITTPITQLTPMMWQLSCATCLALFIPQSHYMSHMNFHMYWQVKQGKIELLKFTDRRVSVIKGIWRFNKWPVNIGNTSL